MVRSRRLWLPALLPALLLLASCGEEDRGWHLDVSTLYASDGAAQAWFGESVAIGEDTLVVGAPLDSGLAKQAGAAYVYTWSPAGWGGESKLVPVGGTPGGKFGGAVAIEGDTIVVGAAQGNAWSGSAHVFVREGDTWVERQKLTGRPGSGSILFGRSIALSGDTCIVGGAIKQKEWDTVGVAYVFVRAAGRWELQSELRAPSGSAALDFGHAVAASGDRALVGAPTDVEETGRVWSFVREGGTWEVEQELVAAGRASDDFYGRAVALWDDTAIVGADNARTQGPNSGQAFVFELDGAAWTETQTLRPDDHREGQVFGYALALHEDLAVVGAPGLEPSAVYVFQRRPGGFGQFERIRPPEERKVAAFGHTVSVWGEHVAVGAYGDSVKGPASGAAFVRSPFAKKH